MTPLPPVFIPDPDPVAVAVGRRDDAALRALLAGLTAADFPYLMAYTPAAATLSPLPPALDGPAYDDGRAFGPAGEVRWRREEWLEGGQLRRGWRVVFVGRRAACPPFPAAAETQPLAGHTQEPVTVRLWGERRGGQDVWLEPRIPRALDYRQLVTGAPRWAGMTIIQYRLGGQVDFVRLLGFAPWPHVEEAPHA